MNKEEFIKRRGEAAFTKMRLQTRTWCVEHPERVVARNNEILRKGGKYYDKKLEYNRAGLQGERNRVRCKHCKKYRPYKNIIAPGSQIHHEWIPGIADFRGVALVEKDQHMHGIVDVIKVLEGDITLLSEKEVRQGGGA